MTHVDARIPLIARAYVAFVGVTIACFAVFALLPFVLSGAWTFSYREIVNQTGVPGYPLPAAGVLIAVVCGLWAPILSFPLPFVWGSSLLRGEIAPALRRVLLPAMVAHVLFVVFVATYGHIILTWMLD